MVRKVNKGVTLVEIIIALAIFMVLMMPLVSALISSMKRTTTGKELQYRNEYAKNLIENVKEVSIDVLDNADTAYFEKMGFTGVSIAHMKDDTKYSATNPDGTITTYPYDTYQIMGTTYLGTERTKYTFLIEMNSEAYAAAQMTGSLNPNNLTSGVVEDLDKSEVALISAALANYDTPAYDALLTKKMSELRKRQEKNGIAYDPVNDVKLFDKDTGNRIINIAVKGNASAGYDVVCTLYYSDNCNEAASDGSAIGRAIGMVDYTPYSQHFEKLPNIYLMYNVGVYNGQYMNDYITYDLSGLEDDSEVNVFVVETASDYSTDVKATNSANQAATGENWLKGSSDGLYRKAQGTVRDGVTINMAMSTIGLTDVKRQNFHVYHNMAVPVRSDYNTDGEYNAAVAEWGNHSKNQNVKYDQTAATAVKNLFSNPGMHPYEGLTNVESLNKALSGNRGLYEIKIWMQEGNKDAATLKSIDPVIQGTRGGNEID